VAVENFMVAHDWWDSGWEAVLPKQALFLHMLVATATVEDLDGDLDELLQVMHGDRPGRRLVELDEPVWWSYPDEDLDDETRQLDTQRRATCEAALAAAGLPTPGTARDLAALMAVLGVFTREQVDGVERWRSPDVLPLPSDRLPLPEEWVAAADARRWRHQLEPSAQRLIRHLADDLGHPGELTTTLELLGRATDLPTESVRHGLAALSEDGEFRVMRRAGGGQSDVDPQVLADHARFVLLIDWPLFHEQRIRVHKPQH
jgi:hypothetical protein